MTEPPTLLPVTTTLVFSHDGDIDPERLKEIAELCASLSAYGAPGSRICCLEMTPSRLTVTMQ
jgi:hypothetical protein